MTLLDRSLDRGPAPPTVGPHRHPDRVVALDAVHNFRDLGGYRIGDGSTIAWGRLFRADGLQRLTEADLGVVDALGVRTVIDLRSDRELRDHGRFPVERLPVAFHHLPVIDATWIRTGVPDFPDTREGGVDFLHWAYTSMLEQGPDVFAHALQVLAVPGTLPAVFHCAAGKDRTGVLAALLLAGLGVDDDVVRDDFALSAEAMERTRAWAEREQPEWIERMAAAPRFMMAAHGDAIVRVLDDLRAGYGSVRAYLAAIGVGAATLEALRIALTR